MPDFGRGFFVSATETSVGAVLTSDEEDSTELRVDVILCFDVERRIVFDWLIESGFAALLEDPVPAHSLPRNREAAACICGNEIPVGTPCDWL